jgi:hypothetical protein
MIYTTDVRISVQKTPGARASVIVEACSEVQTFVAPRGKGVSVEKVLRVRSVDPAIVTASGRRPAPYALTVYVSAFRAGTDESVIVTVDSVDVTGVPRP